ncbi:hypothetical protein F3Y22_tig00004620pilonHSYRG00117 [Hibiscus syriacus]|uniref:Uncharacterized protein n=1 Tax=Hibiscus syriacus TaxID=106335 RepID=A0A6A3CIM1_HIBSY|nr:hypothetical protein F3Y22_tig00004620pilonHSYRG00117 [Hibiscus syriacus]
MACWSSFSVNRDIDDKVERGEKTSVSKHDCLHWLNGKKPRSVIYICFGSLTRFNKNQTVEIANALQASDHSFIWVVGKAIKTSNDEEQELWLPQEFEEKVKENGRGLVIRGWAPQTLILEHEAIGGFLTHCGWNSILEGVVAGVSVGNEIWKVWATQDSPNIKTSNDILMAINTVMGNTDESMDMRKRAKKLGEQAKKSIEQGNSSYNDIDRLVKDIKMHKNSKQ